MGLNRNLGNIPQVITELNGNIGIGTTNPSEKLSIDGSVVLTSAKRYAFAADGFGWLGYPLETNGMSIALSSISRAGGPYKMSLSSQNGFSFGNSTDSVNFMTITSGGYVGIGTTSPGALLDVSGSIYSRSGSILSNNFGGYSGSDVNFTTNTSGGANLIFKTSLTERMIIDSGGNVGIGTTSPDRKLTVNSDLPIRLEANSNPSGYYTLLGTNYDYDKSFLINNKGDEIFTYSQNESLGLSLSNPRAGNIRFSTNGSERMRITSGGNVGIGTPNPSAFSGYNGLTIKGTLGGFTQLQVNGANATRFSSESAFTAIFEERNVFMAFGTNNTERMRITSGGNLLLSTTTDNGYKLQVNGSITATSLALAGNYNADVTTNSGWTSYQTIISPGTLLPGVTYMISIRWNFSAGSNQPYYCYCSFLWVGVPTNGAGGTDNEFTPACSTHTGGGGNISFRSIAALASTSGVQARLNGFSTFGGIMTVKAIRLE